MDTSTLLIVLIMTATIEAGTTIQQSVMVNHKLTIQCSLNVSKKPSGFFQWRFCRYNSSEDEVLCAKQSGENDCKKPDTVDPSLQSIKMTMDRLEIESTEPYNKGTYRCKYMDEGIVEDQQYDVDVLVPPRKPVIYKSPSNFIENHPVNLTCISDDGNPSPTLSWKWKDFLDKEVLKPTKFKSSSTASKVPFGHASLNTILIPLVSDDANSISCVADNSIAAVSSNWVYLNVQYRPIIHDFPVSPYYALIGSELRIECKATSKTTTKYRWQSNKRNFVSDGSYLIINPLRRNDEDSYRCTVTNSVGTSSATLNVTVLSEPVIDIAETITVNEKETLKVVCSVIPSTANVSWWLDDKIVSNNKFLSMVISTVSPIKPECQARVAQTEGPMVTSKRAIDVKVQYKPRKPTISSDAVLPILVGSHITLTCIPNKAEPGYPKPEYSWKKSDSSWTKTDANFISLSSVRYEDSGMYSCVLFNKVGSSEEIYEVVIEGKPVVRVPNTHSPTIANTSDTKPCEIQCQFQGLPKPEITWYKNDLPLENNVNYSNYKMGIQLISDSWVGMTLHLEKSFIQTNDSFRCVAENKHGRVFHDFMINILHGPKQLTDRVIVAVDDRYRIPGKDHVYLNCSVEGSPTILVTWIRKLQDHNELTITNYSDKYLFVNSALPNRQGIQSIIKFKTFHDDDFGRYICSVNNTAGSLDIEFDIRKVSVPDPPHDVIVVKKTWNSIMISWIPGFDGGYPQMFQISYSIDMQKSPIKINTSNSNVTLKYLLPDVQYSISVSATNDLGTTNCPQPLKTRTSVLTTQKDQILKINKEERMLYVYLPLNLSDKLFCVTVEKKKLSNDFIDLWTPMKSCVRNSEQKFLIENPDDVFRARLCLFDSPDVCSGPINPGTERIDNIVSSELIGTIAVVCIALVIMLVVLLFFLLIRTKKLFPTVSNLKVMKRSRKSSIAKKPHLLSSIKYESTLCPNRPELLSEPGVCPLLNTYACDQSQMLPNVVEILSLCPQDKAYREGLYSTLIKNNTITPFIIDMPHPSGLSQSVPHELSSCCCREGNPCIPPDLLIYNFN